MDAWARFCTVNDDGARLFVNDLLLLRNSWVNPAHQKNLLNARDLHPKLGQILLCNSWVNPLNPPLQPHINLPKKSRSRTTHPTIRSNNLLLRKSWVDPPNPEFINCEIIFQSRGPNPKRIPKPEGYVLFNCHRCLRGKGPSKLFCYKSYPLLQGYLAHKKAPPPLGLS